LRLRAARLAGEGGGQRLAGRRPVISPQLQLDRRDRILLNHVQGGVPIVSRPFREIGERTGIDEAEVIERLRRLLESGALSRFGAILSPVGLGGERTLAAMHVPPERFDQVAALVNAQPGVTHNYKRDHHYNMWFVISSEDEGEVARTLAAVERETGLEVLNLPTLDEYFVEFNFHFPED
jgi:DNA-binding Lrp family transcriptional regulator